MNLQEYAPLAYRTAKDLGSPVLNLWHANVGMVTEVGELSDAYKRRDVYGKVFDKVNAIEELGDIFWYLNLHSQVTGVPLWGAYDCVPDPMINPLGLAEEHQLLMLLLATVANLNLHPWTSDNDLEDVKLECATLYPPMVFMLARLAEMNGSSLSQVLTLNINKLAARYGDKYSDYKALNRDTAVERQGLEDAGDGQANR